MELLKAAGILLVIGLVLVAASASVKGVGIAGKITIGIGQCVLLIAVILGVLGLVQWIF